MTVSVFFEDIKLDSEIVMFTGSLSSIPSGWLVCDGSNGTPDLTDRFVKGDSSPDSGSYATGGQDSYTLSETQMPEHGHSGSTDEHSSSHGHQWNYHTHGATYDIFSGHGTAVDNNNSFGDTQHSSSSSGDHSHGFDIGSAGGSSAVDNRPAFYEVAFIMKS